MAEQLTEARTRVRDVDALRGFALLGIFIVNITFMASGYPGSLVTDPAFSSPFDDVVRALSSVFVDMKFYLLFSFLFGYSFTLQVEAAARAGAAFAPRRLQWIGFPVGIAGGVTYALGGGNGNTLAVAASIATAPLLTSAYVATLLRVMHHPRTAFVRDALAPAGRIALTNYLAQALFGLLVFTGVGLGLAGTFSPLATTGLAVFFYAVQLAGSAWWLRRFRYGPAEWLLRWITNARRPAWRVA
ncbi:DUF418 domain-containing protein [Amycolatopsis nalaikhensis]|uniref:DUF418 domain-containing protein n=1 Tax=Amycolatopsis nalaikhensis TaxID=715472 RepID=A0ABY8XW21_9PSEU|nr:DUF418 domain-containing protein [Amycolatopsis sp. 2-2]WIV59900.1 DUF418 domain-containing protein [Amycolatopsis sp. 2-2]